MNTRFLLILVATLALLAGCFVRSTTTITEEISLAGPSLGGDGKVLDPTLRLTVMRRAPCRVTLRDSAGQKLFAWTVPAGNAHFTIAVERGNLRIKQASGETLFKTPVSAPADAVLTQKSDLSKMHQGTAIRLPFHVGSRPNDPLFDLLVDPGGR
jgi:hypothetical protein